MRQQIEALVFVISVLSGPCSAGPPYHGSKRHEQPKPPTPSAINDRGAAMEFRRTGGGCYDDGAMYKTGTLFTEGYDHELQRCYGVLCDVSGQWVNVDNAPCFLKKGLAALEDKEVDGKSAIAKREEGCDGYATGTLFTKGYDPEKRRCYGMMCDVSGQWVYVDNIPCSALSPEAFLKKE